MSIAWNEILQLPHAAYTGDARITKTKLTQEADLSKNEQRELDKLRRLGYYAATNKATTRMPSYEDDERDVKAVVFLRCELAKECGFSELSSILHKAFAHPSILLFEEPNGKVGVSASLKRKSLAEKGAVVVDRIESTKFFDPNDELHSSYLSDLAYESLSQDDLLAFAAALCDRTAKAAAINIIGEYPKCIDVYTPRLMALLGHIKDTQAEINALKLRHRDKGTSLPESSRIRMDLKKKERERDAFVAEIKELCRG